MEQSHWLELVATILEWICVGVIVFGAALASLRFGPDLGAWAKDRAATLATALLTRLYAHGRY